MFLIATTVVSWPDDSCTRPLCECISNVLPVPFVQPFPGSPVFVVFRGLHPRLITFKPIPAYYVMMFFCEQSMHGALPEAGASVVIAIKNAIIPTRH